MPFIPNDSRVWTPADMERFLEQLPDGFKEWVGAYQLLITLGFPPDWLSLDVSPHRITRKPSISILITPPDTEHGPSKVFAITVAEIKVGLDLDGLHRLYAETLPFWNSPQVRNDLREEIVKGSKTWRMQDEVIATLKEQGFLTDA